MYKQRYLGNYPNGANYDPNVPIGYNQWDDNNDEETEDEGLEDYENFCEPKSEEDDD